MRRAVLLSAAGVLLVGPTVLAFFSGGYFDEPRLIATLVAWMILLIAALASPQPLPRSRQGRVAVAGLALIAAWTGASLFWAPLSEPALASFVRLLLYLGALVAAAALLRDRAALHAVEPLLAVGAVVVIGYGLVGRLLPGVVDLAESVKADGRLEQPITYWNAEGLLAAFGLVLIARIAGTESRPVALRVFAAAAAAPLGAGIYLSFSRGAIAAAAVGLIVLLAVAPSWPQLRGIAIALGAAVIAAAGCSGFEGLTALEGSIGQRESEGAIGLAILVAVMLTAGFVQARVCVAERRGRASVGRLGVRRLSALATVAAVIGLVGLVVGGLGERVGAEDGARQGAARLASVESQRYDYWRIGLSEFADHPLEGLGAGGFRVAWLRERPVPAAALEVHSLPLELATELGVVGLIGLVLLVGGVGLAGGRALRRHPVLAPGACSAATVWVLHAAIDWDWQIPAVTLPAIVVAGALVAMSETEPQPESVVLSAPARSAGSGA